MFALIFYFCIVSRPTNLLDMNLILEEVLVTKL